jgi:hypothetical protein
MYVIPPTIGKEIRLLTFDPTDDDYLYFTTWPRTGLGGGPESEVYRWNLCENVVTDLATSTVLGGKRMLLNNQGELLGTIPNGISTYNMSTQEVIEETILDINGIQRASWASDSTVWVLYFAAPDAIGTNYRWVRFDFNGTVIDTPGFSSGTASNQRNGKTVFNTYNVNTQKRGLYIYDNDLRTIIDSLPDPQDSGFPFLNNPTWLSDDEVILSLGHIIVVANFTNQNYRIIKELSIDCDNLQIESVAVVPNRPNEILYTLQYYFYNEAGEYRKRHDIVHLDISTGEERVLTVE